MINILAGNKYMRYFYLILILINAIIFFIPTQAKAGTFGSNYLGVSKTYTEIENQVSVKCANVESNNKAFESCKKRVSKNILKNKKRKAKILIAKKGK